MIPKCNHHAILELCSDCATKNRIDTLRKENTRLRGILEQLRDGRGITIKDMEQALKWRGVNANVFRVY